MTLVWSPWRLFPEANSSVPFDAPAGPGVFEVRHADSGEQVAFGVSPNVANSLATLIPPPASKLRSIFLRPRIAYRACDLEYRVCGTPSLSEARSEGDRLDGRRRAYIQRRRAGGWT